MIAGVVLATRLPHPGMLQTLLVAGVTGIAAVVAWRGMAWRWQVILVCVVWGGSGLAAASWQLARAPASIGSGLTTDLAGVIERLDGRQDNRLRVWIRVDAADDASPLLEGPLLEGHRCRCGQTCSRLSSAVIFGSAPASIRRRRAFSTVHVTMPFRRGFAVSWPVAISLEL